MALNHVTSTPRSDECPPMDAGHVRAAAAFWSPRMNAASVLCRVAICLLVVVAAWASRAHAQDLGVKAPPQQEPVLIVNATVHPVSGPEIANGYVYFNAGKIEAVGAEPAPRIARARVIDGAGLHVYPGLIGAMTQLGLTEISSVRASDDMTESGSITPEVRAAVSVNPDSTLLPVTRANGVLSVGVFPLGGLVRGRAAVIRLDGWTWEAMAVADDIGIAVTWPRLRPINAWWMTRTEEDQSGESRTQLEALAEVFRLARAYRDARLVDAGVPVDLRWEALRGVLPAPATTESSAPVPVAPRAASLWTPEGGPQRPVFVFANDVDQITSAVGFAQDHGLKIVIVGGRDAVLCADVLKQRDVPVMLVGVHNMPRRADAPYDEAFTLPARLHAAGVRWCLASGEEPAHERSLPYHAATAVAFGLPRADALRAITLSAAEILGVGDRIGSLEPGKEATLIVTTGDPLEITSQVRFAFIQGRVIDLETKQTALAAKYREKYRQTGDIKENRDSGFGK